VGTTHGTETPGNPWGKVKFGADGGKLTKTLISAGPWGKKGQNGIGYAILGRRKLRWNGDNPRKGPSAGGRRNVQRKTSGEKNNRNGVIKDALPYKRKSTRTGVKEVKERRA